MDTEVVEQVLEIFVAKNLLKKESINNNIHYILQNNIMSNNKLFIEIDSSTIYPTTSFYANKESEVIDSLESNNTLPLKVRVMTELASGEYKHHVSTLLKLWKLLFGGSEIDAPTITMLISKFGGWKRGGSQRLAREMLQLAAWDGNPVGILTNKAKGVKIEAEKKSMYPDFGAMDTHILPKRNASETLEVNF